jgi:hypothetical protein
MLLEASDGVGGRVRPCWARCIAAPAPHPACLPSRAEPVPLLLLFLAVALRS